MAPDRVICRSDHDYIGRPTAFYWQEQRLEVAQVLGEKRTPQGYVFKVRNAEFGAFELEYDMNTDQWSVRQL